MSEYAENKHEQEMKTLGMAFMGFLMGVGALLGIWFFPSMVITLIKIVS